MDAPAAARPGRSPPNGSRVRTPGRWSGGGPRTPAPKPPSPTTPAGPPPSRTTGERRRPGKGPADGRPLVHQDHHALRPQERPGDPRRGRADGDRKDRRRAEDSTVDRGEGTPVRGSPR